MGRYLIKDIFRFIQRGKTPEGKIVGEFVPTGYIPSFMNEIIVNRLPFTKDKFAPPEWYVQLMNKTKTKKAA